MSTRMGIVIPHLMRDLDVDWLIDAKIPAFAGMMGKLSSRT